MLQRHVDEWTFGEHTRDLSTKAGIEPVVVTDVQESTTREILAETLHLTIAQPDVPVSRDVKERVIPEPIVEQCHPRFALFDRERGPLGNRPEEIGGAGGIGVPGAAAIVL